MRKVISVVALILFIGLPIFDVSANEKIESYEVLILNSYHEGYSWSDDIVESIKIELTKEYDNYNISVEYLDTRNNPSDEYLESLNSFLVKKYSSREYDVIVTSDEAAYNFMRLYGEEVFPDTPFVFCGVNYYVDEENRSYTGVVESYNFEGSIDIALKLNESVENVYVINDFSTTGEAVHKNIVNSIQKYSNLNFVMLRDKTTKQISEIISVLEDDSIVFYAAYFQDIYKNPLDYRETLKNFSEVSSVPIYGMWDFYLDYGIVGGSLTSGFYQGYKAAEYVIRIIEGEDPSDIPIDFSINNDLKFDYEQLVKHGINPALLPRNSVVINRTYHDSMRILVLHSYHSQMKWVESIELGIESVLDQENYELIYDYMDSKRVPDPSYIKDVYEQMTIKHSKSHYDIIVVSDNNAFNFIQKYGDSIFGEIPVVFCGLNNIEQYNGEIADNITGITENMDMSATIDLAMMHNQSLKRLYVINDFTPTGVSNQSIIEEIEESYPDLEFIYLRQYNFSDILDEVATLDDESAVLLLSFNRDKSNSIISYEESGKLISQASSRPVYVMWDFYLGTGVVGGKVTSGFSQGYEAAKIVEEILNGEKVSDIPIMIESPNELMLDYQVLKRFGLTKIVNPKNAIILNAEKTFIESNLPYFVIISSFAIVVLMIHLDSRKKIAGSDKKVNLKEMKSSYDLLSGAYTRARGLEKAAKLMEDDQSYPMTVCFIDLDNLKRINDAHGHDEGDELIVACVNAIKIYIGHEDLIMRYGGDEFVIIFIRVNIANAEKILQNINRHIDILNKTRVSKISFSHGLAEHRSDKDLRTSIKEADANMYIDKQMSKYNNSSN